MALAFDLQAELQREKDLDNIVHPPKVVKPTSKRYTIIERSWEEYNTRMGRRVEGILQPYQEPPPKGVLKNFIHWLSTTQRAMSKGKPTEVTLKNMWYCFRSMYQRRTYTSFNNSLGDEIRQYIKSIGLPRHKHIASA